MAIATAVYIRTSSGDESLFCEPDGFVAEGLIAFLRGEFEEEYPWIEHIHVQALGWEVGTLDMAEVFDDIYAEMDKIDE